MVDPEQRWDGRRPDVENPGVGYFTVNLHHHLKLFVPDDTVCNGSKEGRFVIYKCSQQSLLQFNLCKCSVMVKYSINTAQRRCILNMIPFVVDRGDQKAFLKYKGVLFEAAGGLRTAASTGRDLVADEVQR